ncbi:outer membrane beta-barrel protein [Membranihabitans maritimus]|uniref:outer membrane beta-barrel protein n=1 Tax=Membranihabitans maritimus TaxID=2904244 RepID=UPI001F2DF8B8|nr:outer membrane beta-barrel protein [Membranihabitans maritimus]
MLKRFDRIVKDKLENLVVPGESDWAIFSEFLDIELSIPDQEDVELDQKIDAALSEYNDSILTPQWDLFESRLDHFNETEDQVFDEKIKTSLGHSSFPWNESHWELMSDKLDTFNNRPRILLLKVMEVAAVLLVLLQLPGIYNTVKTTIDHNQHSLITTDNSSTVDKNQNPYGQEEIVNPNAAIDEEFALPNGYAPSSIDRTGSNLNSNISLQTSDKNDIQNVKSSGISRLESKRHYATFDRFPADQQGSLDSREPISLIDMPSMQVQNSTIPKGILKRLPSLSSKNISVASVPMDSILSGVASVNVLRPKLHSSLETGIFADVTGASIKERFSSDELLVNPGMYFRYKLQYGKIFGSMGADYVEMEFPGAVEQNNITMVSLPLELGYNFVNLSSFRMYVSGGIAGRFVPYAEYSPETFDQASEYNNNNLKKADNTIRYGLLDNGPFEINSYLSGRFSIGMDGNINKNLSVNLRLTHDAWLKGKGIGYNYDTFKSSHLALGFNYHF